MRKTMAKFLSVVCVIALAFSVCTFSVMAEETVLGALTAEKLAVSNGVNQLPTCIVNNLTLPEIDGVTWSSSNPAVLANDGTVTRPVAEDANVTLTATAGEETKSFNFTVKAYTTEVHVQDSFAYPSGYTFISNNPSLTPWYADGNDTTSAIVPEADGNQYAAFDFNGNAFHKKKDMRVEDGMVYVEFDVKADPTKITDTMIYLDGHNTSDGRAIEYAFLAIRFHTGQIRMGTQTYKEDDVVLWNKPFSFGKYSSETFVHLGMRIDLANKDFYVTDVNGTEIGPIPFYTQKISGITPAEVRSDDIVFDSIKTFSTRRASVGSAQGILSIDNFAVYTKKTVDEALLALPAEKQLAYVVSDLEEKFPLTDNAQITSARTFALPTYAGLVSWTDENGNALGESVTLTQNQTTFNSGKLIATITPNGSDAKTYTYAYSVLPLETNVRTRIVKDVGTFKSTFNFDGDWEAPQIMNNTPYTNMEFKVYGETNAAITDGITWTTEYESESEVANKVAKFVNNVTPVDEKDNGVRTVSITQGGGAQVNMRMQIGVDFKLVEGNNVTISVTGAEDVVKVPMDFESGKITIMERSNDVIYHHNPEFYHTYNLADFGVTKNSWNRMEIDYSAVGYVYDLYLNGKKVNDKPLNCSHITGNAAYYNNPFRFFHFSIPTGATLLLDNVTVAETAQKNANALVEGAMLRIEKNFRVDSALANGETLYNDLLDEGALPASAYIAPDGTNYTAQCTSPSITWKLDGVELPEVDDRVPLSFTGMGKHTLEATVTYNGVSATKSFEITGAPVALRILDRLIPGVKLGSDISGKLIVATYTDSTMKAIDSVKVYNYVNGVKEDGEFDSLDYTKHLSDNTRLFFISDNFAPIAFDVAR